MPAVTILMPVFNSEKYLIQSIQSILDQSFKDFELLIINDGSNDRSEDIILSFNDDRIRYYKNDKNYGLVYSLNTGIALSKGEYIARMDADDQSLPDRLKLQFEFLETNIEIGLCGTWFELFEEGASFSQVIRHPVSHEEIKAMLLFYSPIGHPTVMIRKSIFEATGIWYDEKYKHAEDYALWAKLIKEVRFANLPHVLLRYRIHDGQVSKEKSQHQKEISDQIRIEFVINLTEKLSDKQIDIHKRFINLDISGTKNELNALFCWVKFLIRCNDQNHFFEKAVFCDFIAFLLKQNISNINRFNLNLFKFFFIKRIKLYKQFSGLQILKLASKSFLVWRIRMYT